MMNGTVIPEDQLNCRVVKEESIARGEWLSLAKITYIDQIGQKRIWEGSSRLTRPDGAKVDGVGVIAFYRRILHYDCIILVKQYRPALKAYTIEMPSGLVEPGETPGVSALRELREASGLDGIVKKIGPVLAMDPGASNCAMRLVTVVVNGDAPGNHIVKSNAPIEKFKDPLLIPVSELLDRLSAYAAAGFIIDSRIDAFAIGLAMGNHSKKPLTPTTLK